jgi:AraC family transcriptional regulator, regulatory protein of adaptative response / DNA-3-methyladenine glycosylase II
MLLAMEPRTLLDPGVCYRALETRDARWDGRFFTCVTTTGIYCRPVCPARRPKIESCVFVPSAAAAQAAGFRPCLRCRPESAPSAAAWRGTASTVTRALALIDEGALDEGGDVEGLAERLGIGGRQLRRLFDEHLGASPIQVAETRRVLLAKRLLTDTTLTLGNVALAAGFGSVRRFNVVIRRSCGFTPRELRARTRTRPSHGDDASAVTVKLPFREPYDWTAMLGFLARRAIPGVEKITAESWRRTVAIDGARGTVEVRRGGPSHLVATVCLTRVTALAPVLVRLRRVFDLDADAAAIARHLAKDARLAGAVDTNPGLRIPGAWDGFELAVRAILGQQVSVTAATTLAGRLVAAHGERLDDTGALLFPSPAALAGADLRGIGLPATRAAAISALASAVVRDPDLLSRFRDVATTKAALAALPGIGAWTAEYVAMRALGEPDAFPSTDLVLLQALDATPADARAQAEAWRPWRAYAAMHLWMEDRTT